jgi:hypothetical protein
MIKKYKDFGLQFNPLVKRRDVLLQDLDQKVTIKSEEIGILIIN